MMQDGASWGPVARSCHSQWLQQLNQRQQAAGTRQLLGWKEAELHKAQELLQQQLAEEMVRPSRSCRAACSKLQDNELQLGRRLFIKYILEQIEGPGPNALLGTRAIRRCRAPPPLMEMGPGSSQLPDQALLALQERSPKSHSAGQQTAYKAVADALLQVPEPAGEDLNTRLQCALEDLERQHGALEMENRLLRKGNPPEACKEAERLQHKNAKLAALTEQLKERCRHLH
ncbi:hypothetical protein QYF61_016924 [Mycteria americana]|uniref:RIMB1/RIM3A-C-like N-terminal domain-containing protein n=1 Tax=Mycteria americana TaxID=33587 RepID=A0AAN7PDV3_MYCAM|nr:hypothetical protein QYF61_016924 [Mycteria americana]